PTLRIDLPKQYETLPSGELHDIEAHEIWKPICTHAERMSPEALARAQLVHESLMRRPSHVIDPTPSSRIGSFDVVFNVSGTPPAGATAALATVATYIESFFSDPITININCSFQAMGAGVLGATSSSYRNSTYASTRTQMVSDMDGSDTLQSFLPTGTTCPVRYAAGTGTTAETRVFFTYANWRAVDGTQTGTAASMTLNTQFNWDYDPSNGITGGTYSFVDVVIHEVGHAMGFTSGVDFRTNDMECLDLFRFQRTDSTVAADWNPDTTAEFQVRSRLVRFNGPEDNHNSDLISAEYRMSDGSPYQGSHFREQSANIGIMDPAFASGQTFYPTYYSAADLAMFDVIGYDN
ncbi:MAG: NF038122 family metalloprotease, partial [Planctomycetota bacterium]